MYVSRIQPSLPQVHFLDRDAGSQVPVNALYLRHHLSRCLLQAMGNGDVKDNIKLPDISEFLLDHDICSVRDIKQSSSIWRDTDIGRLVFTWLKGREPEDSDDDDGSDSDGSDSDSNEYYYDSDNSSSDYYQYEQLVCDGY
ncbi:hypothetical protein DXG03_003946 [Asterophora parasitica]|uniref:Uncharacterized protein n=1 Tax=Asterophora parasitica TaxID=117018 RepID=A0A9P7K845_9AGAR|nr:hypothetical protein DXG03_003946 [Asterophora parasitica]